MTTITQPPAVTADDFAETVFGAALGAIDTLAIHIGDRLGFYRALAAGPLTPEELARRTGTSSRYAREWLEQQAVNGTLVHRETASGHHFELPAAHAEVLTDALSLNYLTPLARMLATAAVQLPALLHAYRTGGGVAWDDYGPDMRESQADMNRPFFTHRLADELAGIEDLHTRLSTPGARIADVGCGAGWSAIALAKAYPQAAVFGFDIDAPAIDLAGRNAAAEGVGKRIRFRTADAGTLDGEGPYDVVFAFECIHDLSRPVEVLAAIRRMVADDGIVVIMDEAVAESFHAPGDELERLMYGFSLTVCLPDGMSSMPSAGTGTVMRPPVLRDYAFAAGFGGIEVLPIDGGFFRFYRLTL